MSRIKVWVEPEGNWSKEFSGLDKNHIIKDAIRYGCRKVPSIEGYEKGYCYDLYGIEIDGTDLQVSNDYYHPLEVDEMTREIVSEEYLDWGAFKESNPVNIASARILKLQLDVFDDMAKAEKARGHFYPIYKAIFDAARVTEPIPEGYCLLLKFRSE